MNKSTCNPLRASTAAPALIATGLSLLLAQCWWSALPAAIGMALVALGAILATIERVHHAPSARSKLALGLFVYATLYLLLVGAMVDAAARGSGSLALHQCFDLGVSSFVMLLLARISIAAFAADGDTKRR